jgi:type-F conjugative transfer system pilin assembly protein TrbC
MLYLLPMKIFSLFLLLLCLLVPGAVLAGSTDLTIPENKHANEGQLAAEQSAKLFQSKDFQEKLSCEKHRLETEVFSEFMKPIKKDPRGANSPKFLATNETLYLFLSSSMPDETVHNYLHAIAQTSSSEISPVMKGMVKGMAEKKANLRYFSRILKNDLDCKDHRETQGVCSRFKIPIKMNPMLFKQFEIDRVPTLVYTTTNETVVIHGDASLVYLLERINSEVKSTGLENLISHFRGKQ